MGTPEYALKEDIDYRESPGADPIIFKAGTLVFVFWNDTLLPKHRREELGKARGEITKYHEGHWMYTPPPVNANMVMCIIGKTWIPIDKKNIRKLS